MIGSNIGVRRKRVYESAVWLQVTMQSAEEQARLNADAMRTAVRAGQAADALGPGRRAAAGSTGASSPDLPQPGRSHQTQCVLASLCMPGMTN